ncbi:PqiC family protein [Hydrogenophaga sp.]
MKRLAMNRRALFVTMGVGPALMVMGCAGTAAPPTRWYELRAEPPEPRPVPKPGDGAVWEVSGQVRLPGALDRDTLVVSTGAASLVPLAGHRWAEPLRDSVPRRLVSDLALLRGERLVWRAPSPAGVNVTRQLRVEIDSLLADSARQLLRLQARWSLTDVQGGTTPPVLGQADMDVPLANASPDALAAGHRMAVWRLAQRIAGV